MKSWLYEGSCHTHAHSSLSSYFFCSGAVDDMKPPDLNYVFANVTTCKIRYPNSMTVLGDKFWVGQAGRAQSDTKQTPVVIAEMKYGKFLSPK